MACSPSKVLAVYVLSNGFWDWLKTQQAEQDFREGRGFDRLGRSAGRPYGKLLPRYTGSIAEFVLTHPQASRYNVVDSIQRTWKVRAFTMALHHFLKKYGLDQASRTATTTAPPSKRLAIESIPRGASRTTLTHPLSSNRRPEDVNTLFGGAVVEQILLRSNEIPTRNAFPCHHH